jgi:hypothetical protein
MLVRSSMTIHFSISQIKLEYKIKGTSRKLANLHLLNTYPTQIVNYCLVCCISRWKKMTTTIKTMREHKLTSGNIWV